MAWLRYDVVTRTIPEGVRDVLEVGCGRGAFGARIARSCNYLGLEPDEASYSVAAARIAAVGAGEVRNVMTDALGDDEKFDMVCAFEVLEHIEDDFGAAKEWASHIRPGKWMLLSVPADQHRYGPTDERVGHFRRYSPEQLTSVMSAAGLSEITVRRYSFPLGSLLESVRDVLASRKLALAEVADASAEERSAASGRMWQPSGSLSGTVNRVGTVPFRGMQRMFPGKGTGLVALGRLGG
jgi:SAM-dependent methyltransferase